jgi:hypothetical protein
MLKLSSSSMLSAAPELERFRVVIWHRAMELEKMPAVRTLECDLKTEVDFVMPRGADFELRLENRSRLYAARSGL